MAQDERVAALDGCEQDAALLRRLYLEHYAGLVGFFRRRLADPGDADDAVQDIFCRIAAAGGAGAIAAPRAYLFEAARNLVASRRRRGAGARLVALDAIEARAIACPAPSPEQQAEARARLARVLAALDALSPRCRAVFVMVRLEQRSYREVARRLGVSVKLVEYYMRRALTHLLAEAGGDNDAPAAPPARGARPGASPHASSGAEEA